MFDDLAKKTNKVEDIFSGTEATAKPDTSRPGALPVTPTTPPPFASAMTGGEAGENKSEKMKKILVFAILIIAVVLIIFGIFWLLKKIDFSLDKGAEEQKQEESLREEKIPAVSEENRVPAPAPTAEETPSPGENLFFPPSMAEPTDSDQDGLSDEEEETLGTNINNIDTDNDGLFDREEVKVYKTNPLVADTDGDGYMDGDEVKNGYNPLGEGKLYEIE